MQDERSRISDRRRHTRNRMYRYIYNAVTPVTKQQLANALGFSLPTVHQNIGELMEAGMIRPGEMQKSTGGRPAVGYTVNEKIRYSVGASVTSTSIRILLTDIRQNEIDCRTVPLLSPEGAKIGKQIAAELDRCLADHGIDDGMVLGVGITFPGVIDRRKNTIVLSPTLKMKDIALSEVAEPLRFPVFIENDSTCGGAAEWLGLSPEEKKEDFVYLYLENGIGGAVFINGRPYVGSNRRSGEFGHMCIRPDGPVCNCGKRGCLEAYCSSLRITRDLGISAETFMQEVRRGNEQYLAIWEDILLHLSIGIDNLRMAFDCSVILGGYMSRYLEPYLERLREMAAGRSPSETDGDYIRLGKYPSRAALMGVAWHFTNEFISGI